MGQYKVNITTEHGEVLRSELFKLESDAVKWSLEQQQITQHNYQVEDLSNNAKWFYESAMKKRESEEPSIKEKIEAILLHLEGDSQKLNEIIAKRVPIKSKYPLVKG